VSAVSQGESAVVSQGKSFASDFLFSVPSTSNASANQPVKVVQSEIGAITFARLDFASAFAAANVSNSTAVPSYTHVPNLGSAIKVALPRSLGASLANIQGLGGSVAMMVTSVNLSSETASNLTKAAIPKVSGSAFKAAGPIVDISIVVGLAQNVSVMKVQGLQQGVAFQMSNETSGPGEARCSYLNSNGEWSFEGVDVASKEQLADLVTDGSNPGHWCSSSHLSLFRLLFFEPAPAPLPTTVDLDVGLIVGLTVFFFLLTCLSALAWRYRQKLRRLCQKEDSQDLSPGETYL
jgi:hypothetical protein